MRGITLKAIFLESINFNIFVFDAFTVVNNPKSLGLVISAKTFIVVIVFKPLRIVFYAKAFILIIMFFVLSNIH